MPYKKGPKGTLRYYRKSDDRYCDDPASAYDHTKRKLSKKEKELLRSENLFKQAKNSKDQNLFDVFCLLEKLRPGCVRYINASVYDKNIKSEREIDIITDRSIYEIKSGHAKHKTRQYIAQRKFAFDKGKDYLVYSPDCRKHQLDCLKAEGFKVFTQLNDLADYERKRK